MKYNRHAKILEIIDKNVIETQEDLAEKLKEQDMDVTQATVSRDIKDLRLIKVMSSDGRYRYATFTQSENQVSNRLINILTEAYVSCDYANNIVVVKTLSGMAQAAGSAIDSLKWQETLGTIAGDDTLIMVCRAEKIAEEIVNKLNKMIKQT